MDQKTRLSSIPKWCARPPNSAHASASRANVAGLHLSDMADKSGLSRSTIEAVERGALGTSLGSYLVVLTALGLSREVDLVADPGLDRDGLALELSATDKRVRVRPGTSGNDF